VGIKRVLIEEMTKCCSRWVRLWGGSEGAAKDSKKQEKEEMSEARQGRIALST